ncbi:helix-turn-helix domain-containing protein [Kitasatospora paracochleata]|uniref:helix-turn-helix domain-containing protein n=1 Tax=Kitasatospora paracochleata TaxID=58354 RepID=UPI0031D4DE0D
MVWFMVQSSARAPLRGIDRLAVPMEDPAVVASPRAAGITSPTRRAVCGRFEEGLDYRTVRPDGTRDWVLFVTVAGRGRLRCSDGIDVLAVPYRVVLVGPGTPHDYGTDRAAGHWSFRWAHLDPRPEWIPLIDWPAAAPGVRSIALDRATCRRVVEALDRGVSAVRSGLRHDALLAMNAVEEALLWCDTRNPREPVLDPRLLAVLEYVGDHLGRPHTVTSLARIAGLSPSRLSHLAASQLGTGLMAHVERRRMELARQLLGATDLPVGQVAHRVGFTDPLYFSRRFRAATGMAPVEFRASESSGT